MPRKYFFPFILVLVFSFQLFPQSVTSSSLNGNVRDDKGNALENATVTVIHQPSGSVYGATTRPDGKYNINNLRAGGPYKIIATYIGYGKQEVSNVILKLGQNLELNFALKNQSVELSEVSVMGTRGEIINSNRTGAATNVSEQVIETFPTINRNFQDFVKFTPQFSGTNFSAAGRNNKYNNLQVDGTQFNDKFGLGSTGLPGGQANITPLSLEAVQEFQVVVAPYDVRFGGFTGGGINAVTKYGTNDWKGSGYYYTRNQDLAGKSPDTLKKKLATFSEYQLGASLGGPIMQDKLFFYVNGELSKRDEAVSNIALTQFTGNANVSALADRFRSILKNKYGYDPGDYNSINKKRPSGKLFLRLDYNLSDIHKLTLRHNYVDGSDEIINPNVSTVIFPDNAYKFETNTNSTALILTSTFSNQISNEFILGYLRIRDRRNGENPRPFSSIQVRESGLQFWAGGEPFSQANELDQDVFEITDNFSYYLGDHVITAGTHNEFYSIRNMFTRDFYGSYIFSSMNNFDSAYVNGVAQPGRVFQYDYSFANKDPRWSAKFSTMQLGFYLQDEWSVMPNLKLTGGVRVDVPIFPDKPSVNDTLTKYFGQYGIATEKIPSGNLLFSPRVAFNWDVEGDKTTQLRGGAGVFSGSLPYVWLSNNYSNTGLEITRIRATAGLNPPFITDPNAQLKTLPGVTPFTSEVDASDPNLKLPQVGRFNIGLDRQLPFNMTGTLELLYTKSINDLFYSNLNVADQTGVSAVDGRPLYNTAKRSSKFTDVLVLKNTSQGYSYNLSFQLQGQPIPNVYLNTAYTYGKAMDLNSVASSQALSQWTFNPIDADPNAPKLTTSNYELKHRIYVGLSYSVDFVPDFTTTFSFFYNGQSGRPFSYTYFGDANKDGSTSNDLIYIPKDNDPNVVLNTGTTWNAINTFINNDDYLKEHRGQIAGRNTSREPWVSTVDFKLTQKVPVYGRHSLEVSLDVLNLLNLLNSEWGWVKTVTNQNNTSFTFSGYDANGKQKIGFSGVKDPFQNDNLLSRFQMQLGIRYGF